MKAIRVVPLAAAMLAALPAWTFQNSAVTDWIRANAIALKTPEAGNGFADLQPLKSVIGNARIVSLGEATHGSREFFQLKHRMLEFLATEMGFTIFTIEANMPEAYRLNEYVLTGKGDPAALLKGMYFWTWDTEEVLAMIQWMREFNASGKGRVEFTGFDMQTPTVAAQIVREFAVKNDPDYSAEVINAARTASLPATNTSTFGVATGTFPVSVAAGKKVKFSGYIKTEGVTRGYAGLWWRVDAEPGKVLAFDNMNNRGARGTEDWRRFELGLPVAPDAKNINFGALMPGNGTAWFDDLKIELDGESYSGDDFALDFEAPAPKGFYTGGNGYRVQLDSEVFHGGKQSLRMRFLEPVTNAPSMDPKAAVATWRSIIEHLESARVSYITKGATAKDVDWAVQNARVVLQCMQLRANQVPRDRSMAENIKWIADHSPDAKIVVWAHNGHVATGGFSYEPMGTVMRRMFGDQLVVFGFAFNQGSFQAINQSGGGLKNFTVPPAKSDSLDAGLASAKIPLMALDLRRVPSAGPVADWFRTPRRSREIGAVYPEDNPYAFVANLEAPKTFDAMLFVEKTTVARKNPGR